MNMDIKKQIDVLCEKGGKNTMIRVIFRSGKDDFKRKAQEIAIGLFDRVDSDKNILYLTNGIEIPVEDIVSIGGEIFFGTN